MTALNLVTKEEFEDFKKDFFTELKATLKNIGIEQQDRKWLRSSDVRKVLKISPATLHNLRINGTLTYSKIGNLYYHKHEDIQKLLEINSSKK